MAQKQCAMCGKLYEACPRCEEISQSYRAAYGYAPWRTVACSVECYQLYDVIRRYDYGQIDIAEAYAMVQCIGELPDISSAPGSKALLDKILAYGRPAPTPAQPVKATKSRRAKNSESA